jgi:NAD(P)-dependent dehydrogenase (short-subunit alcohol dehydrogenase family)
MADRPVLDRFRLDGRVAVVTGASSGLGVAFARALAEAGADVALGARRVTGSPTPPPSSRPPAAGR